MIAQILQGSLIPTFLIDHNHIITHWNIACERLTGVTASKMIGTRKQWLAFYSEEKPVMADLVVGQAPEDKFVKHFGNNVHKSTVVEGAYEAEDFFHDLGEKGRWLFITASPLKNDQGEIIGAIETLQDITARRQSEEDLLKAQEELERRVEERTAGLASINADLEREIANRTRVEEELQLSDNKYRTVAEFTYDWEYWINLEGHFTYISPSCERITGFKTNEFKDNPDLLISIIHPDDFRKVLRHLEDEMMTEEVSHIDFRIITQRGEERWISHFCQPVFDSGGNNLGRRASNRDITKRKRLEAILDKERENLETRVRERTEQLSSAYDSILKEVQARKTAYNTLQENEETLQFTRFSIDHANDMIYWVDPDGKIVDVNETTCIKLGCTRDELLSMTVMDIDPGLTLDKFHEDWENIKSHEVWRIETSHCCKNEAVIPVEIHINHFEFSGNQYNCVFARDITDRRELERLIAIQDKMGSLGRVAAGIAHEIRNPLSTINVYLSTLKRLLASEEFDAFTVTNIKEAITEMDGASHKIETVVKRVMDFSKPSQHKMQLMNVNQCVRDAVDLSAVTMRKSGVALELELDENLPECYMDSQLIEQVMLNLITNAIEELAESDGDKQLLVQTAENILIAGGKSIVITVADSGSGVVTELRDKIFDPFFTTKHYGSGIGLSICHRIISDHNGTLHVATSKWGGALFAAEFPVKKEAAN
ncbi:MAG: PAS domain S-box protein [Desulfobulbaceae bacterium]|nr:PAS domain S-box protein [Desulfobulbaceae bacterium]